MTSHSSIRRMYRLERRRRLAAPAVVVQGARTCLRRVAWGNFHRPRHRSRLCVWTPFWRMYERKSHSGTRGHTT